MVHQQFSDTLWEKGWDREEERVLPWIFRREWKGEETNKKDIPFTSFLFRVFGDEGMLCLLSSTIKFFVSEIENELRSLKTLL